MALYLKNSSTMYVESFIAGAQFLIVPLHYEELLQCILLFAYKTLRTS